MMTVDSSLYSPLMRWSTFFLVLHSAAEGSLIPFLAIFFRQLGLSSRNIGILLSIKVLVGTFFGPLWRFFSRKYGKQKVLLIFSVLACILFRIGLAFLPPVSSHSLLEFCANGNSYNPVPDENVTTVVFQNISITPATVKQSLNELHVPVTTSKPTRTKVPRLKRNLETEVTGADVFQTTEKIIQRQDKEKYEISLQITHGNFDQLNVSNGLQDSVENLDKIDENKRLHSSNSSRVDVIRRLLNKDITKKEKASVAKWRGEGKVKNERDTVLIKIKRNKLDPGEDYSQDQGLHSSHPSSHSLFLAALMVITLGETFASSANVLVRDSLYHHLDDSDNLEQFPQMMALCSISYGISAVLITAIVSQVSCIVLGGRSSLLIQIACSAFFNFASLFVAMFLPLFQPHSLLHTSSRAVRALKYFYSDIHHVFLVLSCILLGFLSSATSGFLFWYMQDLGGTELSMGFYILMESFSQGVVHLKYMRLLRKLGHFGAFSLSFACLSLTYFYFGIMWNPWMSLVVAPLGALSNTLLWKAVSDFLEKSAPPGLYLPMFKQSQIFHAGLGLVVGYSCVGFLGNAIKFKLVFVFWGMLALAWSGAMLLVVRYLPREETFHYAQLFHSKGEVGDSEDEVGAEDWLEKALDEEEL